MGIMNYLPSMALVQKYAKPAPRYTSYPTSPQWQPWSEQDEQSELKKAQTRQEPLSLYFHIPFCEKRCTFCACSTIITTKKEVATAYLQALKKEISLKAAFFANRPVTQIHFGGGTPNYLSPSQFLGLFLWIRNHFMVARDAEISIEIDPRVTTTEHLQILADLGFNRISLGIQDFDPKVQEAIGREQSFATAEKIMHLARILGITDIHCDLIYGLPRQTLKSFATTLELLLKLQPDRLSLFNFAFVPWKMRQQKKINPADLPDPWIKVQLFDLAIGILENNDYLFIGLDHFAKKTNALAQAFFNGGLQRNFQGYATKAECEMAGFGLTAISQFDDCYLQNEHRLATYESRIREGRLVATSGITLSRDDLIRKWTINQLFCGLGVDKHAFWQKWGNNFDTYFENAESHLEDLKNDDLIDTSKNGIRVKPTGRFFLRNIATVFDQYQNGNGRYSIAV